MSTLQQTIESAWSGVHESICLRRGVFPQYRLVTPAEQRVLRGKRVAIAGLGGVGGAHLLTLTRLGVGAFRIADFDTFDVANFNRQSGAMPSTLGRSKAEVLSGMARDINPGAGTAGVWRRRFGGQSGSLSCWSDLYVDGLDFFAFSARRAMFPACARWAFPQ